ncbi:hypothetical protein GCM10023403_29510 [Pseudonocardia benzenivorans]|jgi:hypothetical protein|uniref:hypothetical protein n=1 Tax=Pseudonocardia dioxanivorans TaxID=240495 RepID=UPI0005A2559A|nr:hypothetical protein [Pseudonocardia dioxanivorans]
MHVPPLEIDVALSSIPRHDSTLHQTSVRNALAAIHGIDGPFDAVDDVDVHDATVPGAGALRELVALHGLPPDR